MLRHLPRNLLLVFLVALLSHQGYFSSVQTQENETIFLDISRQEVIINNRQGITRKVAC